MKLLENYFKNNYNLNIKTLKTKNNIKILSELYFVIMDDDFYFSYGKLEFMKINIQKQLACYPKHFYHYNNLSLIRRKKYKTKLFFSESEEKMLKIVNRINLLS